MEIQRSLEVLGLTGYEAKAYTSLVEKGISDASSLSRLTEIPHSKVYEVLGRLEKRKLVEAQKGRPILFKAIKPSIAVEGIEMQLKDSLEKEFSERRSNLENNFKKRIAEIAEAQKVVLEKLENLFEKNKALESSEDLIWTIRGKDNLNTQAKDIILCAVREARLMAPDDDFSEFESSVKTACSKGVKVKLLVHDLTASVHTLKGATEIFQEESPSPTNCGIILADDKNGMFILENNALGFETSSRSVIMILSHFYEHELEESTKVTFQRT